MKKYYGIFILSCLAVIVGIYQSATGVKEYTPMWPNLPAPIGEEPILITSAGQGAEGAVVHLMVKRLNLNADYRPRALATDLYEYKTIILYTGFSKNGVNKTYRDFQEEKTRIRRMITYANHNQIPIILIHLGGPMRDDRRTMDLVREALPYSNYFIGKRNMVQGKEILDIAENNRLPITLVSHTKDILTPLNSVFR